jgi:drug/metabolite transporter (DMT)-like permease
MYASALAFVLLSAILHASWNAQLQSGKNQAQFMASMCLAVGSISLVCVPIVGLPGAQAWPWIALSGALHILYNFLLLQKYKNSELSTTYPISRGVSPILVTCGAFLVLHQALTPAALMGVALISGGILLLVTGKSGLTFASSLPAFATGATIAAYTVVDTIGVQRSHTTASYTVWVFASYLFVPVAMRSLQMIPRVLDRASLPRATCAGVLSLLAYTIVLWATQYVPVGTVSALRETSVLWAVAIGRLFLHERLTGRKVMAAALVCSGVILLVGGSHSKDRSGTSDLRLARVP